MRSGELSAFLPFQRRNGGFRDFLRLLDFPGFAECRVHPAQKIHAVCLSNGSSWSHRALEGSISALKPRPFPFPPLVSPLLALTPGVIGLWQRSESYVFLRRYGRRSGQPSSSSLARRACVHVFPFSLVVLLLCCTTLRYGWLVFFNVGYWDTLNFASALGLSGGRGEMAMAVASSARLAFLRGAVCASTLYIRCFTFFGPCTAMVH